MALSIFFRLLPLCQMRQWEQLYKKCAGRCSIFIVSALTHYSPFPLTSACCCFLLFLLPPLLNPSDSTKNSLLPDSTRLKSSVQFSQFLNLFSLQIWLKGSSPQDFSSLRHFSLSAPCLMPSGRMCNFDFKDSMPKYYLLTPFCLLVTSQVHYSLCIIWVFILLWFHLKNKKDKQWH